MNVFDFRDDLVLREEMLDTLSNMVRPLNSDFRDIINYVLDNKLDVIKQFDCIFYDGDDNMLDLILPAIGRLYAKYFITPPTILKSDNLHLYQLSFDIDDFIDYLVDIMSKVKNSLVALDCLDRTAETISLIVDNYIASRFKQAYECENILEEIREVKLKKIINR